MQQSLKVEKSRSNPPLYRRMYVQLSLLGAIALVMAVLLFTSLSVKEQSRFALESMSAQAQSLALTVANAAGNYMVAEDYSVVEELLLQSAVFRDVNSIQVTDEQGLVIGHIERDSQGVPQAKFDIERLRLPETSEPVMITESSRIISWQPIEQGSIGWVRLEYSLKEILQVQEKIWRDGVLTGVIVFIASLIVLLLFLKKPVHAIENATEFAKQLYKVTGETIVVKRSSYEVEQLEYALNYAATRLYAANKDLSDMKFALDEHAIVGITDSSGTITYVNEKFCNISKYSKGELLGENYRMLNSTVHDREFYRSIWETIKNGRTWHGEMCDQSKDGSLYWVDTTIIPFVNQQGKPYQFISIQTDITERVHAEETNARLGRILDQSSNEIYVFDAESLLYTQVNSGARLNLGYSNEELQAMTPVNVMTNFDDMKMRELLQPLVDGLQEQLYFETVHMRSSRTIYPVDVRIQYFSKETPPLFVAVVQDITERREAEKKLHAYQEHLEDMVEERTNELQLANRELESFCYSVSHDLRAPLRSIDGFSQALVEDYGEKLDDDALDYLERVRNSSQRMGELIDDLLNLSRVVRTEMRTEAVNLSQLATTIQQHLESVEPERKVEFSIADDITAEGDQRLLTAMLENLLGNAWKFTGKTTAARIEFAFDETEKGRVYHIRDNGAGFDPAYAHKLFEPFQRLHSAQEFEGSGIGLATVNRIIRRHGGEVWAEGSIGKGASIYFTLG